MFWLRQGMFTLQVVAHNTPVPAGASSPMLNRTIGERFFERAMVFRAVCAGGRSAAELALTSRKQPQ